MVALWPFPEAGWLRGLLHARISLHAAGGFLVDMPLLVSYAGPVQGSVASREEDHKGNHGSPERPLYRKLKLSPTIRYMCHDRPWVGVGVGCGS